MKKRKTRDEWGIEERNGRGWKRIYYYDTVEDVEMGLSYHRANEPNVEFRVRRLRIPIVRSFNAYEELIRIAQDCGIIADYGIRPSTLWRRFAKANISTHFESDLWQSLKLNKEGTQMKNYYDCYDSLGHYLEGPLLKTDAIKLARYLDNIPTMVVGRQGADKDRIIFKNRAYKKLERLNAKA